MRFIDAQPGDWWTVPTAVIAALLGDDRAAAQARDVCAPIEGSWRAAAQWGVTDPELFRAANGVLGAAVHALRLNPENAELTSRVEDFLERWTSRGRCPADDPPSGIGGDDQQIGTTFPGGEA